MENTFKVRMREDGQVRAEFVTAPDAGAAVTQCRRRFGWNFTVASVSVVK